MEQFFLFFIDYLVIIDYVALNEDPRLIAMIIGNYLCDPNIKNTQHLATVKFHVISMCSVHIIKLLSLITHSDLTLTAEESSYFTFHCSEPE